MTDDPSVKLAQIACEAVAHADTETLAHLCKQDIAWHVTGGGPRAADHLGLEAVVDHLRSLGEAEQFNLRPVAVMGGEDRAAVIFHVTGRRQGRVLDNHNVLLFRIEDELIAEIWAVSFNERADEEFWA